MSPELESKLCVKYPNLFKEKDLPASESCMHWGCAVDDGWYNILERLCDELKDTDTVFEQIKEKFGGLRVYASGTDERMYNIINKYEDLSYKICEMCGSAIDIIQTTGWIKTICIKCNETRR